MRQMHGGVTETGFTWLWTLAKLQLQEVAPQHSPVLGPSPRHPSRAIFHSKDCVKAEKPRRRCCQADLRARAVVAAIRALEALLLAHSVVFSL